MTEHTANGFTAYTNDYWTKHFTELGESLVVAGITFGGGILKGDVHDVHEYFWTQFNKRVMPLHAGQCGGHNYRPNRNNPNKLSNHSSGTASDGDSAILVNGVEALKSPLGAKGVAEVHKILAEIPELAEVIHWGGDWHYADDLTPDPMHIENHDHDLAKLRRVADRIRALKEPLMPFPQAVEKALTDLSRDYGKSPALVIREGISLIRKAKTGPLLEEGPVRLRGLLAAAVALKVVNR